jgi:ABC-type Fe3+/spermidine/putrescine transport system ATPase subunit
VAKLTFEAVEKRFGDVLAVARLDLEVAEGSFLTLLGPSGCGKTTTLRMVAGFIQPDRGRLLIDDEDVTRVPPQKRGIGMVFQDYALFPHLTVAANIGFGLVERGMPAAAVTRRVGELLELVRLPDIAGRFPSELSGGQQQRVALARAVAHTPRLLLMDEPLGALDLKLREAMQFELRRIQQELRITTVYVTHDQHEAMAMSDRIAVMNRGRIEQLDPPGAIYDAPKTKFVAGFVGKINFIAGRIARTTAGPRLVTPIGAFRIPQSFDAPEGAAATLAIRPEHVVPVDAPDAALDTIDAIVEASSFVGNLRHLMLRVDASTPMLVELKGSAPDWLAGAALRIGWPPERTTLLLET